MDLTDRLKEKARELGFAAVGVAPAAPLCHAARAIAERASEGRLRDYGFIRRPVHAFTTPANVLTGAKSIISVALAYPSVETSRPKSLEGRVARFARGLDYHVRVEDRLRELGQWLSQEVEGANWRICVDTGPIIDRAAAREAGVGSYGKNSSIITPEAGSWVVLGELITDAELDFDDPAPMEACGDCTRCMTACPAGAIVEPYVIDQTRCISHLTQMKGVIPRELREGIGDRVYGCDVCQEVCPRNADVESLAEGADSDGCVDLIWLLTVTEEAFAEEIGPSAMAWIGRGHLRRNAAIALGNIGDASAVDTLIDVLVDADRLVRLHSAWALGRIGGEKARAGLESALPQEPDQTVHREIEWALAVLHNAARE